MKSCPGNYRLMMDDPHQSAPSLPLVFAIAGEPAIVINGVPSLSSSANAFVPMDAAAASDPESTHGPGFGEWLIGREVRKMSGDRYFSGRVVGFDEEMNCYRIVYEDDDFEDLEWRELEGVLVQLDVTMPLKELALKAFGCEKSTLLPGKQTIGLRENGTRRVKNRRKAYQESRGVRNET